MNAMMQQALMMAAGTAPSDPYTKSLLHFDGANGSTTFVDQVGKTWTPSGTAQLSTAESVFGGSSARFNGVPDYVETPAHPDFDFGNSSFTMECWVYLLSAPTTAYGAVLLDCENSGGTDGWILRVQPGAAGVTFVVPGLIGFDLNIPLALNQWHHVMACRNYPDVWVGIDGTAANLGTLGKGVWPTTNAFRIGRGQVTTSGREGPTDGYIDEARLSVGIARYATATYTVPTAPFVYP